ncbi:MAG TPA: Cache 3/Cache 2 fusion domain-containing protein [Smithellaceae bacterium]|nr:Cache 3/Cache 2 fusion domain-containing protein [Smithellaceae bacterium]
MNHNEQVNKGKNMGPFFRNLRLDIKIALLGIGSVLITAFSLVSVAVWQSGQYNSLAQNEVDALISADLDHITKGVYNLVKTENEAVQEQLSSNLKVARHILASSGNISLSQKIVLWTATNQFTNEVVKLHIPKMMVNGQWLGHNTNPDLETPLVDTIAGLTGETATIFQRMNEKGDMIRVATTVRDTRNRRAIGTFIPATHANGTPNAVIASILKGKTYYGRAFVVNAWYITAYEPLKDKTGRLVGMLYVGIKQKAVEMRIRQAILKTKVGKTGYVYVLASKGEDRGRYIISQGGERDGEDIWNSKDSEGRFIIQQIIGKATALQPGELTTVRYKWQNPGETSPRLKIARLAYYEPWDWVIGTSVYEDELQIYQAVLSGGRIKMTTIMGIAGLALILVIGLSGVFFAWTIRRPVGQLTRAAEIIMKGNLDHVVPIHSKDEIGDLARTFNAMTEKLRQTMEGLQKSEEKYRTLVETTNDLIFIVDTKDRLTFANRRLEALTGFSAQELQGKPFTDLLNPECRAREINRCEKGIRETMTAPYEVIIADRAGKENPVEILTTPLFDENGGIMGRFGVGRDVTERKKAEEALKISERRLAAFINFLPDATLAIDKRKRVILWNRAMEEMTGIPADEMIGKGDYAYTIPFYGIARPQLMDLFWEPEHEIAAKYPLLKKEGENLVIEAFCPALYNGKGAFVWAKASPLRDSEGQLIGAIECIRDINDHKQAEEMLRQSELNYRSVIDNIQDVFYRSDARGYLIMASPSFINLLGYASLEECLGKSIEDTFYYHPGKRAEFLRMLEIEGRVANYEVILKRKDGTPVIVETNSHFYFDDQGNTAGVEGTFRDITARKKDEETRRKLENQLIQSQKMEAIGTLAGGIAHDFNNILAGIIGYTELYKESVRDRPKIYHGMEEILQAAGRAKDLVTQILTFSRKTEHEKRPVMLAPIVREIIKFMRASLPTTIEIRQEIDETSDIIMADPSQMHQVLMNLCTNAWHAMKDSGGILDIKLKNITIDEHDLVAHKPLKAGRHLELSIRDTGHGIPVENIDKIFDPYFTTKKKGEGTGLGLAVVHGIVREYEGEISVYSELGKGTLFKIYLPLMESQTKLIPAEQEDICPGVGETILFIDDEKFLADMNKALLESLGYRVVEETDPVSAIETFRKDSGVFDLVITDKTMPHLTGYDVAHAIRSIRPDIPVILCSGFQEKEDLEKIKTSGINQIIIKPVRKNVMARTIRNVLDQNRSFGDNQQKNP